MESYTNNKVEVKHIRQDEINDVWKVTKKGKEYFIKFPKSMEYTSEEAYEHNNIFA